MNKKVSTTLRQPQQLIAQGLAPAAALADLEKVAARYAVALTPEVAALIDPADPTDPIARQYLPDARELDHAPIDDADPIGDGVRSPVEGIVHRYPDRVLFKLVHVCAVYCRFCFRREMVGPGKETALTPEIYARALDYIRAHPEIWEVILTGGDPLVLSPRRLAEVMADLAAIDHVRIVRIHSRVPMADPARVTPEMVAALRVDGVTTWLAVHANHPREFSAAARAACARLADAGIPLVSQSVLLAGVNDDAATLEALMRTFVECRIKPYYLHHGDLAPGTAHLRATLERGRELMREIRGRVSGLCQPEFVLDIPGGFGKAPVGPSYLSRDREAATGGGYRIVDYCGGIHAYPPSS
ncbi:MAG: lysine-2,3-aminomutase-like protein [Xanthobacteraceae bacterium]